jgi:MoaA/NifB/PqqE/SkfB family radical SAM enzyme
MKTLIFKKSSYIPALMWRSLKWHVNYLVSKKPFPMSCGLYITSKCNFKCTFCNIWRKPQKETLPFDKVKELVDNLDKLGCFYLSISGGEPLLVDYIFDLISYIKKSNIKYLHMVTNGYFLDRNRAEKLKNTGIDEISISIDGHKDIHDKQRGKEGAYIRAIEAIKNIKRFAPRIKIVLNAVIFPDNIFECLHTLELAYKFGIYVKFQPLNQHPLFNNGDYVLVESREKINKENENNLKKLIEKLRADKRVINSKTFLENIYNFYFRREKLVFKNCDCIFGYHSMEILENGMIFPCLEGLGWKEGIDFRHNLKDILYSDEYLQILKKLRKCKGCENNYYICYYEPRIIYPLSNFIKFYFVNNS